MKFRSQRGSKKGQAAFEYMIIIGFAFLISIPIIVEAQRSAVDLQQETRTVVARTALDSIEEATRFVWSQGEPARITFDITLPTGIQAALPNGTTENFLRFDLEIGGIPSLYVNALPFSVNGTLPTSRGVHTLRATAQKNHVQIDVIE